MGIRAIMHIRMKNKFNRSFERSVLALLDVIVFPPISGDGEGDQHNKNDDAYGRRITVVIGDEGILISVCDDSVNMSPCLRSCLQDHQIDYVKGLKCGENGYDYRWPDYWLQAWYGHHHSLPQFSRSIDCRTLIETLIDAL